MLAIASLNIDIWFDDEYGCFPIDSQNTPPGLKNNGNKKFFPKFNKKIKIVKGYFFSTQRVFLMFRLTKNNEAE